MDVMGVLGESAVVTQGTITAYTTPAGKSARIRLQYRLVAAANSTFRVLVNGCEIFRTAALTVSHCIFTTNALVFNDAATEATVTGVTLALTVAPFQTEFFLNENDTVQYVIGTADLTSINFQVVGVALDIA